MRAARLHRPSPASSSPLRLEDVPEPVAGPGDVVLRVKACGVCRTDLQLAEGDLSARSLPIIPGHQVVGYVISVGADVTSWRVGDRAGVAWLGSTCGTLPL